VFTAKEKLCHDDLPMIMPCEGNKTGNFFPSRGITIIKVAAAVQTDLMLAVKAPALK
jgi:hypothetical protein